MARQKQTVDQPASPRELVKDAPDDLVISNPTETGDKISLPEELVPKAVNAKDLPKQPYWVGTCHGSPFHATRIAGIEFPGSSFENPPGKGPTNHKLGTMLMLTDEQVKAVLARSAQTGWRRKIVEKRMKNGKKVVVSDTWSAIHYDANNPPLSGDKLTANFVYMRKLKHGQRIPLGLVDEFGDPLRTPEPLRT